jgi:dihydrofolate reductase
MVSTRGKGVRRRGERPPTKPNGTHPNQKGPTIMKLATTTHVTVDGVMQGNGGPDEDRDLGFERGGWQGPLWDSEAGTVLNQIFERADAFLFGRRTYEIFAPYWGAITDPDNLIAGRLNARPKYVASTTLADPKWSDTTVIADDLVTAVAELKARQGGELQVHGSGALIRWLLDHQLVDELTLFVHPVILGQGTRLFPDAGPDVALDLVESRSTPNGITIQVYRPTGRPRYARADAEQ